ncbi:28S ribosomal protein S10, mitochondrial [Hyalella azteca]|uniref:Small ribosomal subunit protein uS10m n=1 Tax=Hyalella azteca TaxID=294128 RepID=A0A8B7PCA4_HYAAZ|nr:28S ribosomal protein S10, mitochondrial [Hyalella azteca]
MSLNHFYRVSNRLFRVSLRQIGTIFATQTEQPGLCWHVTRGQHLFSSSAPASPPAPEPHQPSKEEPVYDRLIWKLEVYCEGHEKSVLESYARFIAMTCAHLGINAQPAQFGTPTHERLTLLKSIHIHGKHRVQYEMQTYPMTLTLHHLTGSTADTFLEYTQRMCPEGVAMRVTEHQLRKFPEPTMRVLSDARTACRHSSCKKSVSEHFNCDSKIALND